MKTFCDRCRGNLNISIMSRFNTDTICLSCCDDEQQAPGYGAAQDAERDAVKSGDYNFPGVGLSTEDLAFLAARRKARGAA
jgi:hypothetical protein